MLAMTQSFEGNRVVRDTGCRYPIFNAPVGYFARASLTGAISAAGGFGLMETSSQGLAATEAEFDLVRERTDAPSDSGCSYACSSSKSASTRLDWILDGRTPLVATCVGDPAPISRRARDARVKHHHQVGSVNEAQRAVDGGADGLIVEGAESGGLRSRKSSHLMTLLQQVRDTVDVPMVAAGGIVDGRGMAAAFALGAEGVLMGTRFMSAVESPAHQNWKQAIADTDITLNIAQAHPEVMMRVVRTELAEAVQRGDVPLDGNPYAGPFMEAFENGRIELAMIGAGESATLVQEIKPVADIIAETVDGFWRETERLAGLLARP